MAFRSGITRGFDFGDAGNRFVLAWTPIAGAIAGLVTLVIGDGWGTAIRNGSSAGGAAFLAWAVTRELDPDHPGTAIAAAVVAPLGVLRAGPDLLAAGVILIVARIVAGTTGRGLRWPDLIIVGAVVVPVAWRPTGAGVLVTAVVALTATIPVQSRRRLELAVVTLVVAGAAVVALSRFEAHFTVDPWMLAPAALGLMALAGPKRVEVGTDREGGVISPRRVGAARLFAWVSAAAAGVGGAATATLGPVWFALAVVGLRPR